MNNITIEAIINGIMSITSNYPKLKILRIYCGDAMILYTLVKLKPFENIEIKYRNELQKNEFNIVFNNGDVLNWIPEYINPQIEECSEYVDIILEAKSKGDAVLKAIEKLRTIKHEWVKQYFMI